jgi:hypothetical protein
MCGNNSAVECNLAKVEVAGSNPVSRSRKKINGSLRCAEPAVFKEAASPRGKAEVCKTSIPGSTPGAASIILLNSK